MGGRTAAGCKGVERRNGPRIAEGEASNRLLPFPSAASRACCARGGRPLRGADRPRDDDEEEGAAVFARNVLWSEQRLGQQRRAHGRTRQRTGQGAGAEAAGAGDPGAQRDAARVAMSAAARTTGEQAGEEARLLVTAQRGRERGEAEREEMWLSARCNEGSGDGTDDRQAPARREGDDEAQRRKDQEGSQSAIDAHHRDCTDANDGPCRTTIPPSSPSSASEPTHACRNPVSDGNRQVGGERRSIEARGKAVAELQSAEAAKSVQVQNLGWRQIEGGEAQLLE